MSMFLCSEHASNSYLVRQKRHIYLGHLRQRADPSNSTLVAQYDDLGSTLDQCAVLATCGSMAAYTILGEQNFACAAAGVNCIRYMRHDTLHARVFSGQQTLAWKQHLEQQTVDQACTQQARECRQHKHQRQEQACEVAQQIAHAAELAQKSCHGEAVEGGTGTSALARMSMPGGCVAQVKMAQMQMTQTAEGRQQTEDETEREADEIERVHTFAFLRRAGTAVCFPLAATALTAGDVAVTRSGCSAASRRAAN